MLDSGEAIDMTSNGKSLKFPKTALVVLIFILGCAVRMAAQLPLVHLNSALGAASSSSGGGVISINFTGNTTPMGSSEIAGVVAKSNWNNASGFTSISPLALVDEAGNVTGATGIWSVDNPHSLPVLDTQGKAATLTVNATTGAPFIAQQPQSQTVLAGQSATFTVVISDGPCRSYWYINGAGHYGSIASTISYTIPNTTLAMNGWTVVVNLYDCGSTGINLGNSQTAILTVSPAPGVPTIVAPPANQTVNAGQIATFFVAASGAAPLSYQWQKNGAAISGASAASYTTPATTSSDNGATFRVVVTNSAGSATSNSAMLTVNPVVVAPTITTQPLNQTVSTGQTATFSVAASGTAPLSYQWQKNSANISGATAASYTTPATTSADNGSAFKVLVSNSAGSIMSNSATLTVTANTTPPTVSITSPTSGATVSATITVTASASDNVGVASVRLQVDGTNVGAADTASPYTFSLDTTTLSNGSHNLTAVAIDTSGNQATSASVAVTVSNSVSTGTPGPLAVCTTNPRYFCDPNGNVVLLAGEGTWNNVEDEGDLPAPNTAPFDFNGYMTYLSAHGYNYVRLWEESFSNDGGTISPFNSPYWPWKRVGPGTGNDGLLKTDFTQLDQNYFNRLRARVIQARQSDVYVSVMVYDAFEFASDTNSTDGNPFESANNVNSVNCANACPITLPLPSNVATIQQAYIQKLVDTLHDLPNVMYEVGNEPPIGSAAWVASLITSIRTYESTTYGVAHPIGINYGNNVADSNVYDTDADFIGPSTKLPADATGQCPTVTGNGGAPNPSSGRCKVVLNDSDHSYFYTAMESDGPQGNINWVWENFTHGNSVAFMDPYLIPWSGRNACAGAPVDGDNGLCATGGTDTRWDPVRLAIQDVLAYGKRIDLRNMTPQDSLSTSGYCIANPGSQYLVFSTSNSFTLTVVAGTYTYEWFNPSTHALIQTGSTNVSSSQTFTAPFSGDAVLYLARTTTDTVSPSTPTVLSATAASSSQINLTWTVSTDNVGVAGYKVSRNGVQIATTANSTYADTGLAPSTTYSYTVSAFDAAGNVSPPSGTAYATTPAVVVTLPSVSVTSPASGTVVTGTITLSANASDSLGIAGVQFKLDGATTGAEVTAPPFNSVLNTTSLPNGRHTITATAFDTAGNSATSAGVTITVNNPAKTIAFVQSRSIDCGTATSCTLGFSNANGKGNLLVVAVRLGDMNPTVSLTDSLNNPYALALKQLLNADGDEGYVFYAMNSAGGTNTIRVAVSSAITIRLAIHEFSGLALSNSLDVAVGSQGSSNTPVSGSATTSNANELIFGMGFTSNSDNWTAGSGFVLRETPGNKIGTEYRITSSAGTANASFGLSPSDLWGAIVVAFQ
jgi:hypothetical protein